jgi:hypothetical protein
VISRLDHRTLFWKAQIQAQLNKVFCDVLIPEDSPFAGIRPLPSMSFTGPLASLRVGTPQ